MHDKLLQEAIHFQLDKESQEGGHRIPENSAPLSFSPLQNHRRLLFSSVLFHLRDRGQGGACTLLGEGGHTKEPKARERRSEEDSQHHAALVISEPFRWLQPELPAA